MRTAACIATALTASALFASGGAAQTRVFLAEQDAVAHAMAGADSVRAVTLALSPRDAAVLSSGGGALVDSVYVFHEAIVAGRVVRRAVVVDAMGQYQPITFMVTMLPEGIVERVDVMIYREARGSEVRRRAFLDQFAQKRVGDPIRVGDDIANITGATISSRGAADGVRLALRLQQRLVVGPGDTP